VGARVAERWVGVGSHLLGVGTAVSRKWVPVRDRSSGHYRRRQAEALPGATPYLLV
jgi:hypothetical protein